MTLGVTEDLSLADLGGFSFNPSGGPSSLDFLVSSVDNIHGVGPFLICVGLPTATDLDCNPEGANPISTGVFLIAGQLANFTASPPDVRLVSKITIVPEPSTWLMLLAGFAGIALACAVASRGSTKPAATKALAVAGAATSRPV